MTKRTSALDSRELPGMTEAKRLLGARRGPPTDADRPHRASQAPRPLAGQLSIFGAGNAAEAARPKEDG
jgi:hypothetical protein